jgi:DegV family protein with EDD domain
MIKEMLKMKEDGYTLDEVFEGAQKLVASARLYLIVDTVDYLRRGGRVGPTTALVGSALKLCPILDLKEGAWDQLDTVRGKKKALRLLDEALVHVLDGKMQDIYLSVGHVLNEKETLAFTADLEKALGVTDVSVREIGAPFGTHTGPGALLVFYCKKYEALAS